MVRFLNKFLNLNARFKLLFYNDCFKIVVFFFGNILIFYCDARTRNNYLILWIIDYAQTFPSFCIPKVRLKENLKTVKFPAIKHYFENYIMKFLILKEFVEGIKLHVLQIFINKWSKASQ